MRYVHELSYSQMFQISDNVTDNCAGVASKLTCSVPLDLYVIDLGGGLRNPEARQAAPNDILSLPFKCVLEGMRRPPRGRVFFCPYNDKFFQLQI